MTRFSLLKKAKQESGERPTFGFSVLPKKKRKKKRKKDLGGKAMVLFMRYVFPGVCGSRE
jgi:hypothetical protein